MDLTQFISITPSKKQCPEISKDAPTVCGLTHLSRATIYRMVARGDFPKPFSVFGRKLWLEQDVLDWLKDAIVHNTLTVGPNRQWRSLVLNNS